MTETGRGIFIGTIFVFLACLVIPAFGILAALMVMQVVALGIGWWFRPRLRLVGNWPDQAVAGHAISARFTLTNPSRVPVYQLRMEPLDWPAEFTPEPEVWPLSSLAPGESLTPTFTAQCLRRGRFHLASPVYSSSFPFNLHRFGSRAPAAQEVLILPAHRELELHALSSMGLGGGRLGQARQWIGSSPEYIGSRPFLPGDSPRRIDARAWARLSVPAVKEYFDESIQAVSLVLDTCLGEPGRSPSDRQRDDFEAAVSLAASLACSLPQETTLNTLALGTAVHPLTGKSLAAQVDQVHRLLATVTPAHRQANSDEDLTALTDQLPNLQELLMVGVSWHARTLHLAERAQQQGCHVVMLRIGEDTSPEDSVPVPGVQTHRISSRVFTEQGEILPW